VLSVGDLSGTGLEEIAADLGADGVRDVVRATGTPGDARSRSPTTS
jgi:hypothetical protein